MVHSPVGVPAEAVRSPAEVPVGAAVRSPAGVPAAGAGHIPAVVPEAEGGPAGADPAAGAVVVDTDYPYKEILLEVIMSLQLIELMY